MQAGKLRHRLTFRRPEDQRGPAGSYAPEWPEEVIVWGSLEPLQGREFYAAQQVNAEIVARARIRRCPGLKPNMQVTHQDRTYEIVAIIDPEERHRELEVMLREMPAYGQPRHPQVAAEQ